jgi:hypothetical protein
VATIRPALATYQRKAIVAMGLESDPNELVAQAAARVRTKMPLSAEQARALYQHLFDRVDSEDRPRRRRALGRLSGQVGAAAQQLDGELAPGVIGQERVERVKVADAVEGDHVALVSADGTPVVGKLVDRQRVLSGRLTEITVEKPDGTRERHMLSRNAPLYLMPDLPVRRPDPDRRCGWNAPDGGRRAGAVGADSRAGPGSRRAREVRAVPRGADPRCGRGAGRDQRSRVDRTT